MHSIYQILHVMYDTHNDVLLSDAMLVNLVHVHTRTVKQGCSGVQTEQRSTSSQLGICFEPHEALQLVPSQ